MHSNESPSWRLEPPPVSLSVSHHTPSPTVSRSRLCACVGCEGCIDTFRTARVWVGGRARARGRGESLERGCRAACHGVVWTYIFSRRVSRVCVTFTCWFWLCCRACVPVCFTSPITNAQILVQNTVHQR